MVMTNIKGKWIVVEGPDRIGKSTLIHNLQKRFSQQGMRVITNGFPRRNTHIGSIINQTLKTNNYIKSWKTKTMLFMTDMMEGLEEMSNLRNRDDKTLVITDRYTMSTYAYAKAQKLDFNDNDEQWLMNATLNLLPQPDIYILIVPNDVSFLSERDGFGNEITEKIDIQKRVIEYMCDYANHYVNTSKVIKVVVGKYASPETICDEVVMKELNRIFNDDS